MSPAVRAASPPTAVIGCWAVSVAAGAYLLITPRPTDREPSSLSPYSVAAYLRDVAPADAQDVRVNGLYGSGHSGAWQFVAHVTWRDASGALAGGTTNLPILAGGSAVESNFGPSRIEREHRVGWPIADLDDVLDSFDKVDAALAFVEFEPTTADAVVTACVGNRAAPASCVVRRRDARVVSRDSAHLVDDPLLGPLAVRRA